MNRRLIQSGALLLSVAIGFVGGLYILEDKQFHSARYVSMSSFSFARGAPDTEYLAAGWSSPESWGVWSIGKRAELNLNLSDPVYGDIRLTMDARAHIAPTHPTQIVDVIVNGRKVGQWRYQKGNSLKRIKLDRALVANRNRLQIVLLIQNPVSPKELGRSADARKLVIGLKEILLETVL